MRHLVVVLFCGATVLALSAFGQSPPVPEVDPAPPAATCDAVWFRDADADGFGAGSTSVAACHAPEGYAPLAGDCDDQDAAIHPGAPEVCNGRDDDCDGDLDDDVPTWYRDVDGDGFGDTANTWLRCDRPDGYAVTGGDCDDSDAGVWPGHGCAAVASR